MSKPTLEELTEKIAVLEEQIKAQETIKELAAEIRRVEDFQKRQKYMLAAIAAAFAIAFGFQWTSLPEKVTNTVRPRMEEVAQEIVNKEAGAYVTDKLRERLEFEVIETIRDAATDTELNARYAERAAKKAEAALQGLVKIRRTESGALVIDSPVTVRKLFVSLDQKNEDGTKNHQRIEISPTQLSVHSSGGGDIATFDTDRFKILNAAK